MSEQLVDFEHFSLPPRWPESQSNTEHQQSRDYHEELASTLGKYAEALGAGVRPDIVRYGALAGQAFRHHMTSMDINRQSITATRRELAQILQSDEDAAAFLTGFLPETYVHKISAEAGFEVVEATTEEDIYCATDLLIKLEELEDFPDGSLLAASIKHVPHWPVAERMFYPCRNLAEFSTSMGSFTQRYNEILRSPEVGREFMLQQLRSTGVSKGLGDQQFVDSITAQQASQQLSLMVNKQVSEMQSRFLQSYAQMHGKKAEISSTSDGKRMVDFIPRTQVNRPEDAGITATRPDSIPTLLLMPGFGTKYLGSDGQRLETYVDGMPSDASEKLFDELASSPEVWQSPADQPQAVEGRIVL